MHVRKIGEINARHTRGAVQQSMSVSCEVRKYIFLKCSYMMGKYIYIFKFIYINF
jgi:hypothetical protein